MCSGGLCTSLKTLKANLLLSSVVALTGIGAPIALSFVLRSLLRISSLQAFAAGAALCSTSLGTTFTVLTTSGLTESRLGVVLTSAAMMDDVIGLVMVKVISSLGTSRGSFGPVTVIRPVFVSVAFAVVIPVSCAWIIAPTARYFSRQYKSPSYGRIPNRLNGDHSRFVLQSLFLISMVSGATYAGTSGLFAAYLAGTCVTWFDDLVKSIQSLPQATSQENVSQGQENANVRETTSDGTPDPISQDSEPNHGSSTLPTEDEGQITTSSGQDIYGKYYKPSVDAVIKPFFFASIGFSIPITQMFSSSIVWRGFVYAALMTFGKLLCGIWLIRIPGIRSGVIKLSSAFAPKTYLCCWPLRRKSDKTSRSAEAKSTASAARSTPTPSATGEALAARSTSAKETALTSTQETPKAQKWSLSVQPLSLYPSAILGGAMVARGEIGFLISSVAESSDIFTNELFLVVTWAIFLCTFAGPLLVGSLVRRMKTLQNEERSKNTGKKDPLGIWGVSGVVS